MNQQLSTRIRAVLAIDPAASAIEYQGVWTGWQALADIATGVESDLRAAGLGEGSPVGLVLRNHPATVAAMLGVLLAELYVSTAGIGRLTFIYGENGAYDYMFAAVASVVLVAFLADRAMLAAGALCLRWHESAAPEG